MHELFGGKPNLYPDGGRREAPKRPYIVWQEITDTPYIGMGFRSNSSKVRVQFDIYAEHQVIVRNIGSELEKLFLGRAIPLLRMGPSPEPNTKLFRRTIDMSFFIKGNRDE